jgi:hypothetical protein
MPANDTGKADTGSVKRGPVRLGRSGGGGIDMLTVARAL